MSLHRSSLVGFVLLCILFIVFLLPIFFSQQQQKTQQQAASVSFPDPTNYTSPYGFTNRATVQPGTAGNGIDANLINEYKTLNVHWVRNQILWADSVETTQTNPPTYNWTLTDNQVQQANANGIHMVFVIQKAPTWHNSQICKADGVHFRFGAAEVTQFATALAQRYNGNNGHGYIDAYEIGNEDFDSYYNPSIGTASYQCRTPDYYVPVLEAGYKAIKAQSPNALVGMFGMWWEDTQHENDFLNGMFQLDPNVGNYFDYGNFHFYSKIDPLIPESPTRPTFDQRWQIMHTIFSAHGQAKKPIWCTETGWDDSNPTLQNTAMQEVFDHARLSGIMQKVFWYTINWDAAKDIQPGDRNVPYTFSPLPAFTTYQNYVKQYPTWGGMSLPSPASPSPSPSSSPSQAATPTPTTMSTPPITGNPTTTIPIGATAFSITVCPHGLGNCGDNVNPNSTGNTNPSHTTRNITLTIFDTSNNQVAQKSGQVTYVSHSQSFQGTISIANLPSGNYLIMLKMEGFLGKRIPGIVSVVQGQTVTLPSLSLVNGDINNDNQVDILDYNLLLSCFGSKQTTSSCTVPPTALSAGADTDDDGVIDGVDYNLFIRELNPQNGR